MHKTRNIFSHALPLRKRSRTLREVILPRRGAALHSPREITSLPSACPRSSLGRRKRCRVGEADEEWRKEEETKRGWRVEVMTAEWWEKARRAESGGRVKSGLGRKGRDRGITEDGGSVAALMCGWWVDRVAELWLWNGPWQSHFSRGDLPRPFPMVGGREWMTLSTCHEYLFGESVHRLLRRMTNHGQLPTFYPHLFLHPFHLRLPLK